MCKVFIIIAIHGIAQLLLVRFGVAIIWQVFAHIVFISLDFGLVLKSKHVIDPDLPPDRHFEAGVKAREESSSMVGLE